jgi:hypothetical protein
MSDISDFSTPREALSKDSTSSRNALSQFGSGSSTLDKMRNIDARARSITADQHRTMLQRLFPNALQKVLSKSEVQLATTEAGFQERTLQAIRSVELQLMSDALNAVRVNQAANLRGEMAERLQRRLNSVLTNFAQEFDQFNLTMIAAFERAESYSNDFVKQREIERLYGEIDTFHRVRARLIKNFERIVDEEVRA